MAKTDGGIGMILDAKACQIAYDKFESGQVYVEWCNYIIYGSIILSIFLFVKSKNKINVWTYGKSARKGHIA